MARIVEILFVCYPHIFIFIYVHQLPYANRCVPYTMIYLSGTAPKLYSYMNVITMSDLVENSTLRLNSGSDVPGECFTMNQIA